MSNYRYGRIKKLFIRTYRLFRPSVNSLYTKGPVEDICSIIFVPCHKFAEFFENCIQVLKKERGGAPWDYLEFGVFNGGSLSAMYEALRKGGISGVRLFGFDAFEGLPEESDKADAGVFEPGFYACSYPKLEECLRRRGIEPTEINWVKGWYNETLNKGLESKYNLNPGPVFIDCDTYGSTKTVLDFLAPLITQPTIINLDDWRLYDLDLKGEGEYRAFNEFLEANPHLRARELPTYKRNSRTFLVSVAN
ncbi:MAG: hypothetical protein FJY98_00655 [Candidatus Liptonbacteria bacterium]|nr:hypothetical protein [Candidatus Liptonbacteria bacterium]